MGHGLKLITFYVQKHIATLEMCHNQPLVRNKAEGVPAFVKLDYWRSATCRGNLWVHFTDLIGLNVILW